MPRLFLIVRFSAPDSELPTHLTHDIAISGVPATLSSDTTRELATYHIVDDKDSCTYRVAVSTPIAPDVSVHISYGTTSRDEAMERLQKMPGFIWESDKERRGVDHCVSAAV